MNACRNHIRFVGAVRFLAIAMVLTFGIVLLGSHATYAKSAKEIDVSVDVALERFQEEVKGAK